MLGGYREANFPAVVQVMRAAGAEGEITKGWENWEHRVRDGWL